MSKKELWTDEQFIKYFVEGIVDAQDIKSWTCEQLIAFVYHRLNQKSAVAYTRLELIIPTNGIDQKSDLQKEILLDIKKELEEIRMLSDMLGFWRKENDSVNSEL